jgi:hypothetical protein
MRKRRGEQTRSDSTDVVSLDFPAKPTQPPCSKSRDGPIEAIESQPLLAGDAYCSPCISSKSPCISQFSRERRVRIGLHPQPTQLVDPVRVSQIEIFCRYHSEPAFRCRQPLRSESAFPPKADICSALTHVCFGPIADNTGHRPCDERSAFTTERHGCSAGRRSTGGPRERGDV